MKREGSQEKKSSRSPKRQYRHHREIVSSVEEKPDGIHSIPLDILRVDILWRLPVKSLVRFQCVSKLWSSLIIDFIVARSFTQPRLLVIFPHWMHQSSLFSSSSYYPMITNFKTFISTLTPRSISCDIEYQYIRGLVCCSGDIFNPTKRHPVLVPEIDNDKYSNSSRDGFFGYDPVENQVFTLLGGPKKQQWRSLQGSWDHSPPPATSNGLCINGIIYYISHIGSWPYPEFNELVWFHISFERFDRIQMPKTLQMSRLEGLTLVNYQGRLGCISYNEKSAEMWIMEDHHSEKQEWSKTILSMPHAILERLGVSHRIAGVTLDGEIVIMPMTLESAQPIYAYCYDPKQNRDAMVAIEKGELKPCRFQFL